MVDTIKLISFATTKDEYGIHQPTPTSREVFCDVSSVGSQEWSNGRRLGLNAQYQFKVFFADYQNEEVVEYRGKYYSIYRTFIKGDYIELYVETKKGNE